MSRLSVVALLALALSGCASTHTVMLGQARPAIAPAQVKVYQAPPTRYVEIARLESASAVGFGTEGQTNAAIDRLVKAAAKLGANGVLLLGVDTTAAPVSLGVGAGSFGRHGGASIGGGIPTAQRRAVGIAIEVVEP